MWDYDGFVGKAKVYFARGADHNTADEEFAMWHLLGFEFLLRAPLAKCHASLLTAPNDNDSLLAANGIARLKDPRSAPSTLVIDRLKSAVPQFGDDNSAANDSRFLLNIRNAELHTSDAVLAGTTTGLWLPKLIRVARLITSHLGLQIEELLDVKIVDLGDKLIDVADKKVERDVHAKMETAKAFLKKLNDGEIKERVASINAITNLGSIHLFAAGARVICPACQNRVYAPRTLIRTGQEHLEGEAVTWENVFLIERLDCPVCDLKLENAAELAAAGITTLVSEEARESLDEWYQMSTYDGPEYMDE